MKAMISGATFPVATAKTERSNTEREALEWAYDAYAAGLLRYARAMLGSAEDAEDAVQEVFVRLARGAARVERIRDLRRYLLRSTRNAVYEALRSRKRRERLCEEETRRLADGVGESGCGEMGTVIAAFEALPSEQREALALKVFYGLTFREIGQVIGKSENTAASRCRYAVEHIRKAVGVENDGQ